jgi:hypothetical protein
MKEPSERIAKLRRGLDALYLEAAPEIVVDLICLATDALDQAREEGRREAEAKLRDAIGSAHKAHPAYEIGRSKGVEEGRREERERKSMPHTCTSCGLETMLVWGEGA